MSNEINNKKINNSSTSQLNAVNSSINQSTITGLANNKKKINSSSAILGIEAEKDKNTTAGFIINTKDSSQNKIAPETKSSVTADSMTNQPQQNRTTLTKPKQEVTNVTTIPNDSDVQTIIVTEPAKIVKVKIHIPKNASIDNIVGAMKATFLGDRKVPNDAESTDDKHYDQSTKKEDVEHDFPMRRVVEVVNQTTPADYVDNSVNSLVGAVEEVSKDAAELAEDEIESEAPDRRNYKFEDIMGGDYNEGMGLYDNLDYVDGDEKLTKTALKARKQEIDRLLQILDREDKEKQLKYQSNMRGVPEFETGETRELKEIFRRMKKQEKQSIKRNKHKHSHYYKDNANVKFFLSPYDYEEYNEIPLKGSVNLAGNNFQFVTEEMNKTVFDGKEEFRSEPNESYKNVPMPINKVNTRSGTNQNKPNIQKSMKNKNLLEFHPLPFNNNQINKQQPKQTNNLSPMNTNIINNNVNNNNARYKNNGIVNNNKISLATQTFQNNNLNRNIYDKGTPLKQNVNKLSPVINNRLSKLPANNAPFNNKKLPASKQTFQNNNVNRRAPFSNERISSSTQTVQNNNINYNSPIKNKKISTSTQTFQNNNVNKKAPLNNKEITTSIQKSQNNNENKFIISKGNAVRQSFNNISKIAPNKHLPAIPVHNKQQMNKFLQSYVQRIKQLTGFKTENKKPINVDIGQKNGQNRILKASTSVISDAEDKHRDNNKNNDQLNLKMKGDVGKHNKKIIKNILKTVDIPGNNTKLNTSRISKLKENKEAANNKQNTVNTTENIIPLLLNKHMSNKFQKITTNGITITLDRDIGNKNEGKMKEILQNYVDDIKKILSNKTDDNVSKINPNNSNKNVNINKTNNNVSSNKIYGNIKSNGNRLNSVSTNIVKGSGLMKDVKGKNTNQNNALKDHASTQNKIMVHKGNSGTQNNSGSKGYSTKQKNNTSEVTDITKHNNKVLNKIFSLVDTMKPMHMYNNNKTFNKSDDVHKTNNASNSKQIQSKVLLTNMKANQSDNKLQTKGIEIKFQEKPNNTFIYHDVSNETEVKDVVVDRPLLNVTHQMDHFSKAPYPYPKLLPSTQPVSLDMTDNVQNYPQNFADNSLNAANVEKPISPNYANNVQTVSSNVVPNAQPTSSPIANNAQTASSNVPNAIQNDLSSVTNKAQTTSLNSATNTQSEIPNVASTVQNVSSIVATAIPPNTGANLVTNNGITAKNVSIPFMSNDVNVNSQPVMTYNSWPNNMYPAAYPPSNNYNNAYQNGASPWIKPYTTGRRNPKAVIHNKGPTIGNFEDTPIYQSNSQMNNFLKGERLQDHMFINLYPIVPKIGNNFIATFGAKGENQLSPHFHGMVPFTAFNSKKMKLGQGIRQEYEPKLAYNHFKHVKGNGKKTNLDSIQFIRIKHAGGKHKHLNKVNHKDMSMFIKTPRKPDVPDISTTNFDISHHIGSGIKPLMNTHIHPVLIPHSAPGSPDLFKHVRKANVGLNAINNPKLNRKNLKKITEQETYKPIFEPLNWAKYEISSANLRGKHHTKSAWTDIDFIPQTGKPIARHYIHKESSSRIIHQDAGKKQNQKISFIKQNKNQDAVPSLIPKRKTVSHYHSKHMPSALKKIILVSDKLAKLHSDTEKRKRLHKYHKKHSFKAYVIHELEKYNARKGTNLRPKDLTETIIKSIAKNVMSRAHRRGKIMESFPYPEEKHISSEEKLKSYTSKKTVLDTRHKSRPVTESDVSSETNEVERIYPVTKSTITSESDPDPFDGFLMPDPKYKINNSSNVSTLQNYGNATKKQSINIRPEAVKDFDIMNLDGAAVVSPKSNVDDSEDIISEDDMMNIKNTLKSAIAENDKKKKHKSHLTQTIPSMAKQIIDSLTEKKTSVNHQILGENNFPHTFLISEFHLEDLPALPDGKSYVLSTPALGNIFF